MQAAAAAALAALEGQKMLPLMLTDGEQRYSRRLKELAWLNDVSAEKWNFDLAPAIQQWGIFEATTQVERHLSKALAKRVGLLKELAESSKATFEEIAEQYKGYTNLDLQACLRKPIKRDPEAPIASPRKDRPPSRRTLPELPPSPEPASMDDVAAQGVHDMLQLGIRTAGEEGLQREAARKEQAAKEFERETAEREVAARAVASLALQRVIRGKQSFKRAREQKKHRPLRPPDRLDVSLLQGQGRAGLADMLERKDAVKHRLQVAALRSNPKTVNRIGGAWTSMDMAAVKAAALRVESSTAKLEAAQAAAKAAAEAVAAAKAAAAMAASAAAAYPDEYFLSA